MGDNGNLAKIFPRRDPKAPKIHPGSLPEQPWALKIHSFPQSRPEKGEKATQGRESRPKVGESRPKVGPRDPRRTFPHFRCPRASKVMFLIEV